MPGLPTVRIQKRLQISMALVRFVYALGDCCLLQCEARVSPLNKCEPNAIKVTFGGAPFNCDGIMLDVDGELEPLRDVIAFHALKANQESLPPNRAPRRKKHGPASSH